MKVKLIMHKFIVILFLFASPISAVLAADNNSSAASDAGMINSIDPSASAESKILFPYGQSFIDTYKLSFEDEEYTITSFTDSSNGNTSVKVETISPTPTTLYTDSEKYSKLLSMYAHFINDLPLIQYPESPWQRDEFESMLSEVANNPYADIQVELAKAPNPYNFEETYSERIKSGYNSHKFESPFSDFEKFFVSEMQQLPEGDFKIETSADGLVEKYIHNSDHSAFIELFYSSSDREAKNIVKIVKTNPLQYTDFETGHTSEGISKEVYSADKKNGFSMSMEIYFAPRSVGSINDPAFAAQFDGKYLCFLMAMYNFSKAETENNAVNSISIDARPQFKKEWIEHNCIEYSETAPEVSNFKNLSPEFISAVVNLPGIENASLSLRKSASNANINYNIWGINAQIDTRGKLGNGYYLTSKNYMISADQPYFASNYSKDDRTFFFDIFKDQKLDNIGGTIAFVLDALNAPSPLDSSKTKAESIMGVLTNERYLNSASFSQTAISYEEFNSYVQEGQAFSKEIALEHSLSVQYKISKAQSEEYRRVPQIIQFNKTGIKPFPAQ